MNGPLLLRGGTLLPMDGPVELRADVLIRDRRIAAVGERLAAEDAEVVDCSGCYVMPGLVQTHVHLVQTLFRGLAEDLSLLDWLRRRVWPLEAAHDERTLRASVRMGLLDLLLTGTTTVLDMGTTHGGDVVAQEIADSGIRARFGQAMMDAGEGVPEGLLERTRDSLDAGAALARRWHGHDDGRLGYAYAPRFALSCTRELLEEVAAVAARDSLLVHTHSNEDAAERRLIEEATGFAPAAYLHRTGIAAERTVIAHGVNVDDDELALLASSGAAIAHCPSSNLKLGAGVADVPRLRAAGITVGLGADGAACNNRLDAFEEARLAALLARYRSGPGALTAMDVLRMATVEGAHSLKLGDVGVLAAGMRADVTVLDGGRLAPGGDAATRIVFGGGSRAVRDVVVDGRVLVRDGAPLRYEAAEVRIRAAEAAPELARRAGLA